VSAAPLPRRDRPARQTPAWRRRDASYRLPRRDCGCGYAFHADPLDCEAAPPAPSAFSLSAAELVAHARGLAAAGWQGWELTARLDLGQAAA
jgi:hypothetical protein